MEIPDEMAEDNKEKLKSPTQTRRERQARTGVGAGAIRHGSVLGAIRTAAAGPSARKGKPRTYVLVHGAWHGGWVWNAKGVAAALRAKGHTVTTPTLTGLGERKDNAAAGYDLETHVQDIVDHIEMENLKDIHLVGWSYGGVVVTGALARIAERVKSVIYLDAFVPDDGQSLFDYVEPAARLSLQSSKAINKFVPPNPLSVFGIKDQALIEYVQARQADQAWQTFFQPVKALKVRPNIPHTYIRCTDFVNPSFDAFLEKFKKDPLFTTYELKTSHLAMMTAPKETIELLAKAR